MHPPRRLKIFTLMAVLFAASTHGIVDQRALAAEYVPRALWVWSHPDPGLPRFARAHRFDRLLVSVPTDDAGDRAFVDLADGARRRGIEVFAVSGDPSWALDPAGMIAWTRQARRADLYAGLVLDVEPYVLGEWDGDASRDHLMRSYLRALERAVRAAEGLPVWAAVPFWFDHDRYQLDGRSLLEQVVERVDGIVVMAYRDRADGGDGILSHSMGEIAAGAAAEKPVMIGVQTAADELDKLTFHEEGAAAMQRELDRVIETLRGARGFGGVAVHHLDSYRQLRP